MCTLTEQCRSFLEQGFGTLASSGCSRHSVVIPIHSWFPTRLALDQLITFEVFNNSMDLRNTAWKERSQLLSARRAFHSVRSGPVTDVEMLTSNSCLNQAKDRQKRSRTNSGQKACDESACSREKTSRQLWTRQPGSASGVRGQQ